MITITQKVFINSIKKIMSQAKDFSWHHLLRRTLVLLDHEATGR